MSTLCLARFVPALLLSCIPTVSAADTWIAGTARNDVHKASIGVNVESPKGKSPGTLTLVCYPARDVGLYVELEIADASLLTDIDFDDFEGPDATYGKQKLATLSIAGPDSTVTATSNGAGWYNESDHFTLSLPVDHLPAKERTQVYVALTRSVQDVTLEFRQAKDGLRKFGARATGEPGGRLLREIAKRCEKSFKGRR